jgi:hypothetical protein
VSLSLGHAGFERCTVLRLDLRRRAFALAEGEDLADPTPTPTPTPPPDVTKTIKCGDLSIPIVFPGDGGEPIIKLDAAAIKNQLKPGLKG